ncbi:GatB/YqeY domain-containing protein [Azospirillum sp. B4]|uniref:GatB/YqeY domain-containing protein n=1 Tax=Azospirillum sp. B4 TaxID=95605 RepID=UPI0003489943|nr:GatB/YqeY domain-containing protein [Azospirillum sp. B4]
MLRERFTQAMKDAMRAKDQQTLGAIRLIMAALKDRDIAARPSGKTEGISDAEIATMLQGMVKQRRESIEMYRQGGREELAASEQAEIDVIMGFLPKQMTEEETKAAITALVAETGAAGIKDMGKVMAGLKEKYAGQMDFSRVGPLVKAALNV